MVLYIAYNLLKSDEWINYKHTLLLLTDSLQYLNQKLHKYLSRLEKNEKAFVSLKLLYQPYFSVCF